MEQFEIIALVSTILCVILSSKENILAWPIGIISAISLIFVYLPKYMYANILLQTIFVIQCSFGWYNWGKKEELKISKMTRNNLFNHFVIFILFGCIFAASIDVINNQPFKITTYLDGISTSLALLGNWYLIKKRLEAWSFFMLYNFIVAILFLIQEMYLLVGLNICLLFISFNSFKAWKRNLTLG